MPQHLKLLAKSRMNFFNRASSLSFGRSARSPKFDQEEAEDDQTGDYLREGVCKAPHQAEPARRHPKTRWYGMDADEHPEMTGWLRKRNTKAKGTLVCAHSLHVTCRSCGRQRSGSHVRARHSTTTTASVHIHRRGSFTAPGRTVVYSVTAVNAGLANARAPTGRNVITHGASTCTVPDAAASRVALRNS
jgi:hypothetical protein